MGQSHLSNKLKLPFKDLDNSLSFAATDKENELENFARYEKFVVRVMSETSEGTAKIIIQEAAKNFGVDLHDNSSIKRIKNKRPVFEQFTIPICDKDKELVEKYVQEINECEEKEIEIPDEQSQKHTKLKTRRENGIQGAKVQDGFKTAFNLMKKTHEENEIELSGNVVVLNSADGSAHTTRLNHETNMCSSGQNQ